MITPMKIDFVSDVSCPWCVIGLHALEQALVRVKDTVQADITLQPFELNPDMAPEGQETVEHLMEKYRISPEQVAQNGEAIRARGEALGFTFHMDRRDRIYNTFDAHRLLHWAAQSGHQLALKHALFRTYFTEGRNPGSHDVLVALAEEVGLDGARAREILASNDYAEAVRHQERFYHDHGVHSVPAGIINVRHLIQGGQPVEVFEAALRQIAEAA